MLICSRLTKILAGLPPAHLIGLIFYSAMRVVPWFVPNSFMTVFTQTTVVHWSDKAVSWASVKLDDIDFCNSLISYMGALPFQMRTPVRVLPLFSCVDPQFQSKFAYIWFNPPDLNLNGLSEIPCKSCNARFADIKLAWQDLSTYAQSEFCCYAWTRTCLYPNIQEAALDAGICCCIFLIQDKLIPFYWSRICVHWSSHRFWLVHLVVHQSLVTRHIWFTYISSFPGLILYLGSTSAFQNISWSSVHPTCSSVDQSFA